MAANDPQLRGADRVREVFARVRRRDPEGAADLYAEDGVLLTQGQRIEGREAIRTFYRSTFERISPKPEVQAVLESDPYYAAILEVPLEDGHARALDLFRLGDDGIEQLEIYARY